MQILEVRHAAELLAPVLQGRSREALAVAHLDGEARVLTVVERPGDVAAVDLPLRDIVADGLRLGSQAIILGHNHPSGDSSPSQADISATRRLAELCDTMGIRLCDHLVFARTSCTSMRVMGLL